MVWGNFKVDKIEECLIQSRDPSEGSSTGPIDIVNNEPSSAKDLVDGVQKSVLWTRWNRSTSEQAAA